MSLEQYGQSSEHRAWLIDQMEFQLDEFKVDATENEFTAERVAPKITNVSAFKRRRPTRKSLPGYLPRERVLIEASSRCACCV